MTVTLLVIASSSNLLPIHQNIAEDRNHNEEYKEKVTDGFLLA